MSIIWTLKDLHLTLYAEETPNMIPFLQYSIKLLFISLLNKMKIININFL